MYYEEKVVNGVLCFRVTPNGDWQPMSVTELTGRVVFAEKKLHTFAQAREALKWLVYLHCGISKFGGEKPITPQEWEEAIESGREALAAMEATHEHN